MSKFIKYDSTLTSVTATGTFDHRELSGRPEFTGRTPTLQVGFSGVRTFEGYNFDSVQGVMLRTYNNQDLAGCATLGISLTSVTTLPYLCGGATIDPALVGFFLTPGTSAGTYTLNNYNNMSIAFPTISAVGAYGIIDVVPINAAGFASLSTPINGFQTDTSVSATTDHGNQIYVHYSWDAAHS